VAGGREELIETLMHTEFLRSHHGRASRERVEESVLTGSDTMADIVK